jgi:neurotransmitter:Na+ symporter, NSS family
MDFWVGTGLIFIMATVQIVCFSWVFGVDRGMEEAHRGARMRIPRVYRFILKFVAPSYLLVVFAAFCWQSLPGYIRGLAENPVAAGTMGLIGAVLALLLTAVWLGERRWRAEGRGIDGISLAETTKETRS